MVASPSLPDYQCFVGVDIAAASFTALWATEFPILPRAVTFAQTHRLCCFPTAPPGSWG